MINTDNKAIPVELPVKPEIAKEKNCEILGCNAKAVNGGNYCKPHNNGMIGCSTMMVIILLYFICYLITKL